MKRSTVHGFFAVVCAGLLLTSAWQAYRLFENRQTINAVNAVPDSIRDPDYEINPDAHPAVLLATATALSAGGQFEAAESSYVKLIDQQQLQPLGQAARYNLANHYLKRGMRTDLPGGQTQPLIEIAKQRYRDLLHSNADDWDARVNLEYALRLAPELSENDRDKGPPIKSVNVIVPDFKLKDLP